MTIRSFENRQHGICVYDDVPTLEVYYALGGGKRGRYHSASTGSPGAIRTSGFRWPGSSYRTRSLAALAALHLNQDLRYDEFAHSYPQ